LVARLRAVEVALEQLQADPLYHAQLLGDLKDLQKRLHEALERADAASGSAG
jgi:hypothetical protein